MKLAITALLLASTSATAATVQISDYGSADDYWQVQNASSYQTACEGRIVSCETNAGVYHVINLSTGERFNNVSVADTASSGGSTYYVNTFRGIAEPASVPFILTGSCAAGEKAIAVNCVARDYGEIIHPVAALIHGDELGASCQPNYDFEGPVTLQVTCASGQ